MKPSLDDLKALPPRLANIDEPACIGCTKCIKACPFDAILGTQQAMHVILPNDCTGCGLCVEPCPVDCITLLPLPAHAFVPERTNAQYERKQLRLQREQQAKASIYHQKRALLSKSDAKHHEKEAKKTYILDALQRVKQKRS